MAMRRRKNPTAKARAKARARRRHLAPSRIGRSVAKRIYVAGLVLGIAFTLIGYKAYAIQIRESARYQRMAERQHLRKVEIPAPRGDIRDGEGRDLAVTADVESVFVNPRKITDVSATSELLAEILGLDVRVVEDKLSTRRHFEWIKRHLTATEAQAIVDADIEGLGLTLEPRRFYPGKALAAPVLGSAGIDGAGLDGVELELDTLLAGERGEYAGLRDASGRVTLADGADEARPGATVYLTIDRAIQHIAERALEEVIEEHLANAGSITVLDVNTGAVLAMANYPTFDPNGREGAASSLARNRAVTDAYEIGSIMKVFGAAAAIDEGLVTAETLIDLEGGRIRISGKTIKDTHVDWELSVANILKYSSNVGAVKIAQTLGKDLLREWLVKLGFGNRTGIELPGERAGILRKSKHWGEIGLATIGFGYNMTVTPLQVAAAFAALGNGGIYYEPRVVQKVVDSDGEVLFAHEPTGRRVFKASTVEVMAPILASVFDKGKDGGTMRSVTVPGYIAGGKTGTAHKVNPDTLRYSNEHYLSSFAGLVPIADPEIVVVIVIDQPSCEQWYGAQVAGPAFAVVASEALRYLGVPTEIPDPPKKTKGYDWTTPLEDEMVEGLVGDLSSPLADHFGDLGTPESENSIYIPDFRGLSFGQAVEEAELYGVQLHVEGWGRVVEQIPAPGMSPKPAECRVVLAPRSRGR
jgi:cell division protein FtsI (penicillin-binding protein 3)